MSCPADCGAEKFEAAIKVPSPPSHGHSTGPGGQKFLELGCLIKRWGGLFSSAPTKKQTVVFPWFPSQKHSRVFFFRPFFSTILLFNLLYDVLSPCQPLSSLGEVFQTMLGQNYKDLPGQAMLLSWLVSLFGSFAKVLR